MKREAACLGVCIFGLLTAAAVMADSDPVRTMNLSGATGLYVLPTGRVGWEGQGLGFNAGYHFTAFNPPDGVDDLKTAHNIGVNLGFLKYIETSLACDLQPDYWTESAWDNADVLAGIKVQIPFKNEAYPAVALGGNFQLLNLGGDDKNGLTERDEFGAAGQVYIAVTYGAAFFGAPVETTAVVGKTLVANPNNRQGKSKSNVDFGMGLDVVLFPKVLQNYVRLIAEYANFSYSGDPLGADAGGRGVMNAGVRFDLSQIPALNKLNFTLDIMGTDILDHRWRGFSAALVFGMPVVP
jgi:hypothetical protein